MINERSLVTLINVCEDEDNSNFWVAMSSAVGMPNVEKLFWCANYNKLRYKLFV